MSKLLYPDFFNDVFAPVMQPGSSGSFAGTCRIGQTARHCLKSEPKRVRILFQPSSHFFQKLGNMMDDRAYLGGLLGFDTDDIRLFSAHELAREQRLSYEFLEGDDNQYPSSVTFEVEGWDGDRATLIATSVGGGRILAHEVNGFPIDWHGDDYGLLLWNTSFNGKQAPSLFPNCYLQHVEGTDAQGKRFLFIETSQAPGQDILDSLAAAGAEIRVLPPLFRVVTSPDRQPQLYTTVGEWRDYADSHHISFVEAAIAYEKAYSGWSDQEIWDYFEYLYGILYEQVHSLDGEKLAQAKDTPMLPVYGKLWAAHEAKDGIILDSLTNEIVKRSLAVNAKLPGVKIVPGPMGTGGGYLFSAIDAVAQKQHTPHQKVLEALVVAASLGALAYTHSNATGASGCAGETGVCNAMGAGAIAWMCGGNGIAVEHAASMAIQASLGLFCDPIPGGLEFPCITRTIRAAVTAPLYAELALSGIDPILPYHEALQVIDRHFRETPNSLLCGPTCGACTAPSAGKCMRFLGEDVMKGKLKWEAL